MFCNGFVLIMSGAVCLFRIESSLFFPVNPACRNIFSPRNCKMLNVKVLILRLSNVFWGGNLAVPVVVFYLCCHTTERMYIVFELH